MLLKKNTIENYLVCKLQQSFSNNFKKFPRKILIALSGGIDSMALVIIAKKWCDEKGVKLDTVTVDHQLRKSSTVDAQRVHNFMCALNIDHTIITWDRGRDVTSNIEALARNARYELLGGYATKNKIPVIITAHHLDDQIETFFMRLSRGSGIDGLSAMNELRDLSKNIKILRPFLEINKSDLQKFLEKNNIDWVVDDSNKELKFLRNKFRELLYEIEDKDIIDKRILQTVKHFERAKNFLEQHTQEIFDKLVSEIDNKWRLNLAEFQALSEEIALRLLVKIFQKINKGYYKPRFENLYKLYKKIFESKIQKRTTFSKVIIAVSQTEIIFYPEY